MKRLLFLFVLLLPSLSYAQFDKRQKGNSTENNQNSSNSQRNDKDQQEDVKGFDPSKLVISPIIGMRFNPTLVQLQPKVGYRFHERLMAGVSFNYIYYKDFYFDQRFNTNRTDKGRTLGGGIWGQYQVFNFLSAAADIEMNSYKYSVAMVNYNVTEPIKWYPSALVGAALGVNGFYIKFQYDLLQMNPNYQNRFVSSFGFFF